MTEIEKTIEDIQKQFKGIGIDYTNGKDMTAVCILGDKAEIVIEALREYAEQQDPKPLTLDELRQMDGEPVYVVTLGARYWAIAGINSNDSRCQNGLALYNRVQGDWGTFDLYGDTWLAYRSKLKEG